MKKHVTGPLVVLFMCLAAGAVYADYDQAMGTIKSLNLDGGKLVVSVRQGGGRDAALKDVTYLIDKETTVRVNREKKALTDLAEGKMVTVFFKEGEKAGDLPKALLVSVFDRPAGGRGGAGGAGGAGGGGGRRGGGGGGAAN